MLKHQMRREVMVRLYRGGGGTWSTVANSAMTRLSSSAESISSLRGLCASNLFMFASTRFSTTARTFVVTNGLRRGAPLHCGKERHSEPIEAVKRFASEDGGAHALGRVVRGVPAQQRLAHPSRRLVARSDRQSHAAGRADEVHGDAIARGGVRECRAVSRIEARPRVPRVGEAFGQLLEAPRVALSVLGKLGLDGSQLARGRAR